jgi:hypothetical protein
VARIAHFFEALQPADVARMGDFYTAQAYFKDPLTKYAAWPGCKAFSATCLWRSTSHIL